jgi:hypothetical protein
VYRLLSIQYSVHQTVRFKENIRPEKTVKEFTQKEIFPWPYSPLLEIGLFFSFFTPFTPQEGS